MLESVDLPALSCVPPSQVSISNAAVLSVPALPVLSFRLWHFADEIVGTLGEGTFGRVMECIDHRRYVRVNNMASHSKALRRFFTVLAFMPIMSFRIECLNAFKIVCFIFVVSSAVWLIGEEVTLL